MADIKLPASTQFFKNLSLELHQLKLILHVLENFALQALIRGYEVKDGQVLYILEQLERLVLKSQQLMDDLERRLYRRTAD